MVRLGLFIPFLEVINLEKEDIPLMILLLFASIVIGVGGMLTIFSIINIVEWIFRK